MEERGKERMKLEETAAKYVLVPELRQTPNFGHAGLFAPRSNKVTSLNSIGCLRAVNTGSFCEWLTKLPAPRKSSQGVDRSHQNIHQFALVTKIIMFSLDFEIK